MICTICSIIHKKKSLNVNKFVKLAKKIKKYLKEEERLT